MTSNNVKTAVSVDLSRTYSKDYSNVGLTLIGPAFCLGEVRNTKLSLIRFTLKDSKTTASNPIRTVKNIENN